MAFFAFIPVFSIMTFLFIHEFGNETTPDVPKRPRPQKSVWIKSFISKMFDGPPRGFLWSQLILPCGYVIQPSSNNLDHHTLRQDSSDQILKHLWLMMELQHASPMTGMTLLG